MNFNCAVISWKRETSVREKVACFSWKKKQLEVLFFPLFIICDKRIALKQTLHWCTLSLTFRLNLLFVDSIRLFLHGRSTSCKRRRTLFLKPSCNVKYSSIEELLETVVKHRGEWASLRENSCYRRGTSWIQCSRFLVACSWKRYPYKRTKIFFEFFKTKKHVDKCIPPRLVKYHFKPFSMTKPKGAFPKTNITKKKFILQFILVTLSQKPRIQVEWRIKRKSLACL